METITVSVAYNGFVCCLFLGLIVGFCFGHAIGTRSERAKYAAGGEKDV